MGNESIVKQDQSINVWQQKDKIRQLFAPTLTADEFEFFMGLGKGMGANPFKREIWAIKYDSKKPASIFLGRDFYRKAAQSQPDYKVHRAFAVYENDIFKMTNGVPNHEFTLKNRGKLVGGYAELWKKDIDQPFVIYCELKEYDTGFSNWKKMPATMIAKVPEAQVLRMAYQEIFSGTYSEDEQWEIKSQSNNNISVYDEQPKAIQSTRKETAQQEPLTHTQHTAKEIFPDDAEGSYADKILNFLKAEYSDGKEAGDFLENLTSFENKEGKTISGKRKVEDLSLGRQKVCWHKIEKLLATE